jgi:hypothetical protein
MKRIITIILIIAVAINSADAQRRRRNRNKNEVKSVDSVISNIKVFDKSLGADSLNVEQIAFDYFLSKIDSFSFDAYSAYRFNRSKQRILYSGNTDLFTDFLLGNFKTYAFRKKKFIDAGTFDDRNNVISCSHDPRPFTSSEPFCVKDFGITSKIDQEYKKIVDKAPVQPDEANPNKPQREYRDVYIQLSNRYFFENYYYVRIKIVIPDYYLVQTYFYAKIDTNGEPINWVATSDVE